MAGVLANAARILTIAEGQVSVKPFAFFAPGSSRSPRASRRIGILERGHLLSTTGDASTNPELCDERTSGNKAHHQHSSVRYVFEICPSSNNQGAETQKMFCRLPQVAAGWLRVARASLAVQTVVGSRMHSKNHRVECLVGD
eukprot:1176956-Prorocentrum_minimum.AAC.2